MTKQRTELDELRAHRRGGSSSTDALKVAVFAPVNSALRSKRPHLFCTRQVLELATLWSEVTIMWRVSRCSLKIRLPRSC